MQEALTALLLASTAVTTLIGDRLTWDVIEQGSASPNVVLFLVSDIPDYHMAGASGLVESRVQIDCRATDPTSALAVARAIESVLSGYRGNVGAIKFSGIFIDNRRTDFDDNGADRFFRVSTDYQVFSGAAV